MNTARFKKCFHVLALALISLSTAHGTPRSFIDHPFFNSDSSLLVLERCINDRCAPWIIDIVKKTSIKIEANSKHNIHYPRFHPKEKLLVAVKVLGQTRSFVLMDFAGHIKQEFQRTTNFQALPLILKDGKSFIFVGPGEKAKDKSKTRLYDFYESVIGSELATRITRLNAFAIYPTFSGDDDKVFFFGVGLSKDVATPSHGGYYERLDTSKFSAITSFDMSQSVMARDGTLAYIKRTDDLDGRWSPTFSYDIFIHSRGPDRRLTDTRSYIRRISISPDGQLVAAVIGASKADQELRLLSITGETLIKMSSE